MTEAMRRNGRARRGAALRIVLAAVGLGVVLALVALVHRYLLGRLVLDAGVPEPARSALAVSLALLAAAMVLQPAAERLLPLRHARRLAWPAYVWMGALFLLLSLTLASDALLWLMAATWPPGTEPDPIGPARLRALAVAGIGGAATLVGLRGALAGPVLRRLELRLDRWPAGLDGFRIVQISDIHIGPMLGRAFAGEITERVNALAPDLIAVTGDLVDGSVERLRHDVAPLAGLRARHGTFFVTGNHDWYSGAAAWVAEAEALGFRALRNERVTIGSGAARFELAGVDDQRGDWLHGSPCDVARALAGRDPAVPVVLLAHDPTTFAEASQMGVDLQLSGHTHGGQIWPFRYLVRLAVRWVEGLHERDGCLLYVSRGTGFWGPPLRLLAPAEITEITLRAPEAA